MPRTWLALKVALTAALLAGVLMAADLNALARVLEGADTRRLAVSVLLLITQTLVLGWRFAVLARSRNRALGAHRAVELSFVGVLFNQALPSAVGGDAVRAWRLAASGWGWWSAASAVLVDRASGVVVLAILAAGAAALEPTHALRWLSVFVSGIALMGSAAYLGLALGDRLPLIPRAWRSRLAQSELPATARSALAPRTALALSLLSATSHALAVLAMWLIALALGAIVSFTTLAAAALCVLLVTMIPVSFAGWGIREAGAIGVFGLVGLPEESALALSLLFGAAMLAAALPGVVYWLAPSGFTPAAHDRAR